MEFVVGCDLEEFKSYYRTLRDLHNYYETLGLQDVSVGELGVEEEYWVTKDLSHLIVWREGHEIVGHAIWHETSTDDHKRGDPRDKEDKEMLRGLLGGRKDNLVELHEVWLSKKYRGRGYGSRFFEFFEDFCRKRSYGSIVYYTDNDAAMAVCRKRGYKEGFLARENWRVFCFMLSVK